MSNNNNFPFNSNDNKAQELHINVNKNNVVDSTFQNLTKLSKIMRDFVNAKKYTEFVSKGQNVDLKTILNTNNEIINSDESKMTELNTRFNNIAKLLNNHKTTLDEKMVKYKKNIKDYAEKIKKLDIAIGKNEL